MRRPTDLIEQSRYGLLPPGSYALLQGIQLPSAIPARVATLELNKQFERGLVRLLLETLHHLCPVILEDIATDPLPFVIEHSVGLCADSYTAGASVFPPAIHASEKRSILPRCEPTRELDA